MRAHRVIDIQIEQPVPTWARPDANSSMKGNDRSLGGLQNPRVPSSVRRACEMRGVFAFNVPEPT